MEFFNKVIYILLASSLFSFSGCAQTPNKDVDYTCQNALFAPKTPDFVMFCGDTIKLDNEYLRERFDREMINFTFGHSVTFQILKKSGRYFPDIEKALRENNIPDDLKYLCAMESNLNNKAVSSVKAAGLWQFMPETAKDFGLTVNEDIDERFDVTKETVAACKYLKQSFDVIGEWAATAASYNTGRARVIRQMKAQMAKSFFEMTLSEETNRYVFRILALKVLMENPSAFGFNLSKDDYYHEMSFDTVGVDSTISNLALFAREHSVNYMMLKEANPWLRTNQLPNPQNKHYVIRIPVATEQKK